MYFVSNVDYPQFDDVGWTLIGSNEDIIEWTSLFDAFLMEHSITIYSDLREFNLFEILLEKGVREEGFTPNDVSRMFDLFLSSDVYSDYFYWLEHFLFERLICWKRTHFMMELNKIVRYENDSKGLDCYVRHELKKFAKKFCAKFRDVEIFGKIVNEFKYAYESNESGDDFRYWCDGEDCFKYYGMIDHFI